MFLTIWLQMVMIFYDFARTWTMTWRIGVLLISKSDISTYVCPSASDLARNPKFRFASIRLVPCVLSAFLQTGRLKNLSQRGTPAESVCIWPEQNRFLVDDRSPPNRLKALRKSTHSLENLQIPDLFPDSLKFRKIRVFQSTQCFLQIAKRHGHAWFIHALRQALAVSGLSVIGRDKWGVFPLRGKARGLRKWSPELEWLLSIPKFKGELSENPW